MERKYLLIIPVLLLFGPMSAQKTTPTIKKEAEVMPYDLPPLLITETGKEIETVNDWEGLRRPEIHSYFANQVYGVVPGQLEFHKIEVLDDEPTALGGRAIRKQVNLIFKKEKRSVKMSLLIYLPKNKIKSPVFLAYNFKGNYKRKNWL